MSVRVISLVFENGPEDLAQHAVMLALADNADDQGVAFPGVAVIARKSRQSERNTLRVIAALEVDGWLTVRRRSQRVQTERGPVRMGNTYCLNLARMKRQNGEAPSDAVSHDTQSPPAKVSVAKTGVAKARTAIVSRGGDEVTLTARRGDNDAFPIRKNRQEPPTTPLPPASGGSYADGGSGQVRKARRESAGERQQRERAAVGTAGPVAVVRERPPASLSSADVREGLRETLRVVRGEVAKLQESVEADGDDLLAQWDEAFAGVEYESHEAWEGVHNGITVTVVAANPVDMRAAVDFVYSVRLERVLRAVMGCRVALAVQGREAAAA